MWSVIFVFLSYLDRNLVRGQVLDADKENKEMFSVINGTLCAKMSAFGENFLYQVSDGAEVVRSVVSPAGKLVHCSITVDRLEVRSFTEECRSGVRERRTQAHLQEKFARLDEAKRSCEGSVRRSSGAEEDPRSLSEDRGEVLRRSKRGFTYPGTLWCGAGNMADTYEQLGDFTATDSCCRTHDHCPHVIHAFSSKYGYTNFKWHSICHCGCDETLKSCLRKVNDTSSRVVGQAFFNVIGVPCFKLKYERQCAERHWYGMCKRYETFPIAVIKEAVPYDYGGIDVIDKLTLRPPRKEEVEKPEGPTQPTGPEEPSLGNMVTAAEDFIKVLATVSTSQSSATDADKNESQTSERKKKKKNKGKKKKKTKKRKGKGGKRKQQPEEAAPVPNAGGKAEEAVLSNFLSEPQKPRNAFVKTGLELAGRDETSNEVMKDEPVQDTAATAPLSRISSQKKRPKKGRKKPPKPLVSAAVVPLRIAESVRNTTDCSTTTSGPTMSPATPSFPEKNLVISEAASPIEMPQTKRNRSKERGDPERRKKRRKISSDPPSETLRNSSAEDQLVIPLPEGPTRIPEPTTEVSLSPTSHTHLVFFRTPLPSSSPLKKPRSKKKGGRNKRKKVLGLNLGQSTSKPIAMNLRPSGTIRKHRRTKGLTTPPSLLPTTQEPNLNTLSTSSATRPPMSPVQVSLERAREQFSWKKRRKAALLSRQHRSTRVSAG